MAFLNRIGASLLSLSLSSCVVPTTESSDSIGTQSSPLSTHFEVTEYDLSDDHVSVGFGHGYPKSGAHTAWAEHFDAVDAGFRFSKNGKIYLFRGSEYLRYDAASGRVDPGYPKRLGVDGWLGGPRGGIDAILEHPTNGYVYFFTGAYYWRFSVRSDRFVSKGRLGVDGWRGVWKTGVDAALLNPANGVAYFFKDNEYTRYDLVRDAVTAGYPKAIGEPGWKGVRKAVSAAFSLDDATVQFVHPGPTHRTARAIFNMPDGNGERDAAIHNELIALLDDAEPGSRVWLLVPGWDIEELARATVRAIERGVDVRAVHHRRTTVQENVWFNPSVQVLSILHPPGDPYADSIRPWTHSPASREFVQPNGLSQFAGGNINHIKAALFERTTSRGDHVTVLTSSNWRAMDQVRQNDAVVLTSEPVFDELSDAFERIWRLVGGAAFEDIDVYKFGQTFEIDQDLEIYLTPSPRGRPSPRDPHLELLKDARCFNLYWPMGPWGSPGSTYDPPPTPRVWVAGSTWGNTGRGREVMDELVRLKNEGCDVRIAGGVRTNGEHETEPAIFQRAEGAGIPWVKTRTHSKYIFVDAPLVSRGARRTTAVVGGNLNFSTGIAAPYAMADAGFTIFNSSVCRDYEAAWLELCGTGFEGDKSEACLE